MLRSRRSSRSGGARNIAVKITEILPRRSDLSTFLVHLTRDFQGQTAKQALLGILTSGKIEARSPFGHALSALRERGISTDGQRAVCFTETPLEYTYLLLQEIEGRSCNFGPYGVALTKRTGREAGINPVWYVDISPAGRDWLSKSINVLVDEAIKGGEFDSTPVSKLAPFIEQMGSGTGKDGKPYRKEFWWEREWRYQGNLSLYPRILVLCPEEEFDEVRAALQKEPRWFVDPVPFVDPRWGLEQIIARLAGFMRIEVDLL
jgi:hypothetical protein